MPSSRPARSLVVHSHRGVLATDCAVADRAFPRLRGLLGRRDLPAGTGLLLCPSGSVHTCFMRFAIDVVFLGDRHQVVGVSRGMGPWRAAGARGARAALELPAGAARDVQVGDRLALVQEERHGG